MASYKQIYWVITNQGDWGRGTELKAAIKNAKVKKGTKYVICIGVVKDEATSIDLLRLLTFYNVNDLGGITRANDLTKEDESIIEKLLLGWITELSFGK